MKQVYLLVFLHEEEGIEDPKGIFSSKKKLEIAVKNMQIDFGSIELKEGSDYKIYEIPFDRI